MAGVKDGGRFSTVYFVHILGSSVQDARRILVFDENSSSWTVQFEKNVVFEV